MALARGSSDYESWGDVRAWDGTVGVGQPLIAPSVERQVRHRGAGPDLRAIDAKPQAIVRRGDCSMRMVSHCPMPIGRSCCTMGFLEGPSYQPSQFDSTFAES